mmetsp:Transcript_6595/g.13333  ORF Transcript_6595/g.13333 Transcript_6595/m.13333 type:complete len:114 (-) Transcript_6595:418-759(-)
MGARLTRPVLIQGDISARVDRRNGDTEIRACIGSDALTKSGSQPTCSIAKGLSKSRLCQSTCSRACALAAEEHELRIGPFPVRRFERVCTPACVAACDQPGRVAKSEFRRLFK